MGFNVSGSGRDAWCSDCEYSEPVHLPEGMLRCRRYAPRPEAGGGSPTKVEWPLVRPEDWCGEFLKRLPDDDEGLDPLAGFSRGHPEER